MAHRRPVYVGACVCLILALALLLQPASAHAIHHPPHPRPDISFSVRISRATAMLQRRKTRESITIVVTVSGKGLKPHRKFTVQNNVIIRVNRKPQAVMLNTSGPLESENNTMPMIQADDSGALSTDIVATMNGPAEQAGTVNSINETVNLSDSAGQQLAITDTTAAVTSQ
jgi:hypothetical protein